MSTSQLTQHQANGPPAAFEDFLQTFKTSSSATETSATNALQDLNIEEDDLSEEYDFMDDVDGGSGARARRMAEKRGDPKKKYMTLLQDVADRYKSEITIELDDLDVVRLANPPPLFPRRVVC